MPLSLNTFSTFFALGKTDAALDVLDWEKRSAIVKFRELRQRWPEAHFQTPDTAPVPKILNHGPEIGSDSGNHRRNRNSATLVLKQWHLYKHADSWYCRKDKVTPDPVFHKFLTPDPGPQKMQNPAGVDFGTLDPWPHLDWDSPWKMITCHR